MREFGRWEDSVDKGSKRVTIKDIAQRCGVTANTVSRALRGDTRISEATLKKVQQMAQEMGYIRNNLAATMRSGRSNLISIIVDDIENPHYATLVHKMSAFLKENGYNTMTLCTQAKSEEMVNMANLSIANYVDGILYFPYSDDAHVVRMIQRAGIPLVLVDRAVEGADADVARFDDYRGGVLAAEYLYEAGHRKFAYICGTETNGAQPLRRKGVTDRLAQYGVEAGNITIINEERIYSYFQKEAFMDILRSADYTGIFIFSDSIAYLVMNVLREYGYRVPEEISIIGFDYIRGFLPYLQPLTSIAGQKAGELAKCSVSLLLRRIQEPEAEFVTEILPVMLPIIFMSLTSVLCQNLAL